MDTLSPAELTERVRAITETAFRNTLTEAVIVHHVRTYVRIRDTNKTRSIGIAWMDERPDLFHDVVASPLEFYRKLLQEGPFARLLLLNREYLKAVLDVSERKSLIHELICLHSIPDVSWVNNILSLGVEPHEARAFVRKRIELDLAHGSQIRPNCFARAYLRHGQKFKAPLTPYAGVWHLMKQDAFFEIAESLAPYMPILLLSQMKAIGSEFHAPTHKLTERCVGMLQSLDGVDVNMIIPVSSKKSWDLLFRLKAVRNDAADAKALLELLNIIMHRVDDESQSAAVQRVEGLMQVVEPRIAHRVLHDVFSKSKIEQHQALNNYANKLQQKLDRDP